MKAAVYTKTPSGKILQIMDVEKPSPKDDEVLIKVRAAAVNPLDWRMKRRRPGADVAGDVEAIGDRVTRFKIGDAVLGICNQGSFAEYACAPEKHLAIKPPVLSYEQAASMPIAALTALQGLRDHGHLQPGQKVLINGAAGGVGTFAVQIAKWMGAEVTGVCSTTHVDMVRSLGADRVIDYTREDFTTSAERYDLLLDNVANRPLSACRRVLARHGRYVMVGAPKKVSSVLTRLAAMQTWYLFLPKKFTFFIARMKPADMVLLCGLVEQGKIQPVIGERYELSDTGAAIAHVEEGHAAGKVVICLQPEHAAKAG